MSFRKITVKSGNEEITMDVTEEEYQRYYRPWWRMKKKEQRNREAMEKNGYTEESYEGWKDGLMEALRKLKDNNGNYIWQPSVQAGVPDMILNRPYHTSSYVPEVAAGSKVMAFGDFSYYWIADRQGRSFKRLNELFAATGQVGFLASQRVDGKLILSEAVKTMKVKSSASSAS